MKELSPAHQSDPPAQTTVKAAALFSRAEKKAYISVYCFFTLLQFCFSYIWIGDDCRGPGAKFPGGCHEYTAVTSGRFHILFLAQFLLVILLLFAFQKIRVKHKYRMIAFVMFSLFLIFGQMLIFLPPLPAR